MSSRHPSKSNFRFSVYFELNFSQISFFFGAIVIYLYFTALLRGREKKPNESKKENGKRKQGAVTPHSNAINICIFITLFWQFLTLFSPNLFRFSFDHKNFFSSLFIALQTHIMIYMKPATSWELRGMRRKKEKTKCINNMEMMLNKRGKENFLLIQNKCERK